MDGWFFAPSASGLLFAAALLIILFGTVFGAANIYVKALNRVKQR